MTTSPERHLSAASFAEYAGSGVPMEHPIAGTPKLTLFFDPRNRRVGLRGPVTDSRAVVPTGLEHLTVQTVLYEQQRMTEIAVTDPLLFMAAYPVLMTVADRVQLDGLTLLDALADAIRRLGHLLKPEARLIRETEIGLLGELCLLSGLARTLDPGLAVQAWRGAAGEEHDFGLDRHDVEVKTTTSERRTHWITSLTQLVPTGDRSLWLVSLQVTAAGYGGRTLPGLIEGVRELLATASLRDTFDERLYDAGWRDHYSSNCQQRWRLRSPVAVFDIVDGFPRLTPALLPALGASSAHIKDVRYRLDLTGRQADDGPDELTAAVQSGQTELA